MLVAALTAGLAFALPLASVRDPDFGTVELRTFTETTSLVAVGLVILVLACLSVGVRIFIVGSTWAVRGAAVAVAGSLVLTLTTFVGSLDRRLVEVPNTCPGSSPGSGVFFGCGVGTRVLSDHFVSGPGVYAIVAALVATIAATGLLLLPSPQGALSTDTVLRRNLVKVSQWYRGHGSHGASALASAAWASVLVGWSLVAVAVPLAVVLRITVATTKPGGLLGPVQDYPAWAEAVTFVFWFAQMLLFAVSLLGVVLLAFVGRGRHAAEGRRHSSWMVGLAAGLGFIAAFIPIFIDYIVPQPG